MLVKKSKRALSVYRKVTALPRQSIERKKITAQIADREKTRSLKNSSITKPFPTEHIEEKLREAEHFLNNIFASIQDGISILDKEMNIIRVNQAMERWYSHAMPLVGKKCYEAYRGRKERCNVCPTHQTILARKAAYEVVPKVGLDGKILGWLDLYSFPLIDTATERMSGVIQYVRDITERKRAEEALLNAAQQWRTTFDGISDIVCMLDKEGRIIRCNKAMTGFLGKTFREIINRTHSEMVHGAQMPVKECPVERLWKTHHRETDIQLINDRWFSISVDPLLDEARRLVGAVHIMSDITERKRAEEALRSSEEKYRTILETMWDGYWETDVRGNFTFVNDAQCRTSGCTRERLIGMNNRQFTSEEEAKKMHQVFNRVYRTGEPVKSYQFEYTRRDGTKSCNEISVSLMRDTEGKPIGFQGVSRDITERKRAEEALLESEEQYRLSFTNVSDVIFTLNSNLVVSSISPSVERILGYKVEELVNRPIQDLNLIPPEYLEKAFSETMRIFSGEQISNSIYEFIAKDGTRRVGEISGSPLHNNGKIVGSISVARDITERKQAEEEKSSLQEQLRQSQKMEAIGQLAGGVAHDFNNLLTVIKGYSQLSLLDLKENDPLWENIQEIQKATQRATDLTRQLLAFSRRQVLDLKVLNLNVLLKDLDKMLRRIIGEDIELVTLLTEDLGKVKIDPNQIEQVIFNLAVNARDAMPSGGKLTIETADVELDEEYARVHVGVTPGRYVSLSVSDTGIGMTREVKEKVFDPFFTTKEKGKGTGLGLSMVYGIVKQSNGNIMVYSEPHRGTTFRIYLPRTEEEADILGDREEKDFPPRGSETVLLVEDDELVRNLANRLLEQQGYRVLKASNGQEALLVAKEHVGETIHLLLADIVMPQMGGKELADWLKISRPNVKVLYTSGYSDDAIVHHGVLDPGTHFLQKPFSLKTLSQKVREVLDG
ncbi:MAG TPA: PAS domain S-box protein [Thermodesulfobacteriota bacterium]|nr:PAS domain S-box protein [Thermodesulfobacteriota bacterium]